VGNLDIAAILGKQLKTVSESDTGREQIEYIDIGLLDSDEKNFYQLSEVEKLAANIELVGLQQPIRVRENPDAPGRFVIVSGHRRRAALQLLVDDGVEKFRSVACIRETPAGSAAMQELRLIYANSDTRTMSMADLQSQSKRIEELLYQLKEQEGIEFPGRMRDHVAEICKISKSKLARLNAIDNRLAPVWRPWWKKGSLSEATAYRLSQMPAEHQTWIFETRKEDDPAMYLRENDADVYGKRMDTIDRIVCKWADRSGEPCDNRERMYKKACTTDRWYGNPCTQCCRKCDKLASCKYACPRLKETIQALKASAKDQRRQEELAREERDRPAVEAIQQLWQRFGEARAAAGKSVEEYYKAAKMMYIRSDADKVAKMEALEVKMHPNTGLPYGYSCYLSEVQGYVKIADLFGVSLDYLLCRTDDPQGMGKAAAPADDYIPGDQTPTHDGQLAVGKFQPPGKGSPLRTIVRWQGGRWYFTNGATIDAKCVGWFPLPKEDADGTT
jgi:ParB family chromosome partitioning protein